MQSNQSESTHLADRNSINTLKREQCENLKINVKSTATDSFGYQHLLVGCPPFKTTSFRTTADPKILTLQPRPCRGRNFDKMPLPAKLYETIQDNDDDHRTETTASMSLSYAVSSDLEQNGPNFENSFSTSSDSSQSNEAPLNYDYPSIGCYDELSRLERGKSEKSPKTTALLHALGDSIEGAPKLRLEYLYEYGVKTIALKREIDFIQKFLKTKKETIFQIKWKKKQQMELKKNRVTRKEITQRLYDRSSFESRMEGKRRREEIANKSKLRKEARENDFRTN